MDESRVVVPWEDINWYVKAERATHKLVAQPEVVTEYSGLRELDEDPGEPLTRNGSKADFTGILRS